MKTSFNIGTDYVIDVCWSIFGHETYSVNGKEVLKKWSLSPRGSRKFVIGEGEAKHDVEIKIDFAPNFKSWISPGDWIASAYVDGELVVDDLTTSMRRTIIFADKIINIFLILLMVFAVFVLVYWLIK